MTDSGIPKRMLQARLDLAQRLGREVGKAEIAAKAGIPAPTYGRYESGVRKLPSDLIGSVAAALGTDVAYLTTGVKKGGRRALPDAGSSQKKA